MCIYFPNPHSVFRSYIVLKVFLENVIRDAITYTEHAKRKTITAMDVVSIGKDARCADSEDNKRLVLEPSTMNKQIIIPLLTRSSMNE